MIIPFSKEQLPSSHAWPVLLASPTPQNVSNHNHNPDSHANDFVENAIASLFHISELNIVWDLQIDDHMKYDHTYLYSVALGRIVFFSPPPPSSSLHSVQQMDPFKAREDQMDQSRLLLLYHSIYIANDKQGCFRDCMSCTMCTKVHHMYTSYDELLSVAILRS